MLGFAIDVFYVLWIDAASRYKYAQGAVTSMALAACSMFGWFAAYDNNWLSIPYLLGLGTGTVAGIWYAKHREKKILDV